MIAGVGAPAAAADAIRARLGDFRPRLALILGSGLGGIARHIADRVEIPYAEVPAFPVPTVAGHPGCVIAGTLEGTAVVALAGRFHLYEGHPPSAAALPVRVAHALGARTLLVTNAAGGIRRSFRPGDLMLIHDHINLMWRSPLAGAAREGEQRFPDMSEPYDRELLALLGEAALDAGVPVVHGVYAAFLGPSYETPAEIRMLERLGADAVGMSTVPEVLAARALGMRVAGISCITNAAAGISAVPLSHAEVLEVAEGVSGKVEEVVRRFVGRGADSGEWEVLRA
jgi:purine-nucleoside phosphorylase